ncbi:hypothetical protein [Phocaeicola paurosaccharolyticus]|uniref:hypothetical protein n=1 Tax=Phocaeicola paurosaccharolyticus TaxID=732242 RepID=UPI000468EC2D|nr:hypothetical protein [Phocaeicola paurosaccharolyticus]
MKREEKVAIVRILSDLIKADSIIDAGEMEKYAELKNKYNISNNEEKLGTKTTLAEAFLVISEADDDLKNSFYADCLDMTVSDGFCARSEALLMIALKMISDSDMSECVKLISILKPAFSIASSSILYIESQYNKGVNNAIMNSHRNICKETQIAGFNFIYIPNIAQHYKTADIELIKQITSFLAPSLSDDGILSVIESLHSVTTSSFCKDLLCNKLGITILRDIDPSLLLKIGESYVYEDIYANYIKLEVNEDILNTLQKVIDDFTSMLSADCISVSTAEEKSHQFLYHGFYKQLLDIFLIRNSVRSKLYINPYREEIYFPDIDNKLDKLHRREKALYVLLILETKEGGVNFNLPKSAKQLASYNMKLVELQKKYQLIYQCFGGDTAPDLSQAEIRRPIVSCLKRSLNGLNGLLYNLSDYLIEKDEYGNLKVNLDGELIYVYDPILRNMVHLFDSELYKRLKQL